VPVSPPPAMALGNNKGSPMPSSNEETYTIKGSVKFPNGKPVNGIKIQLMDSDQEAFQDRNDDLIAIVPVNDSDGTFEITFDAKAFKDGWLEGNPDIYLMVRNATDGQVIHKTEIRKGIKQNSTDLVFNITINSLEEEYGGKLGNNNNNDNTLYDPFEGNNERIITAFMRLGDVVQFVPSEIQRNFTLIISSINGWTFYTRDDMWRKIKYDGPQVPRYPWRDDRHSHTLSWGKV
jgi:hypothetical protein